MDWYIWHSLAALVLLLISFGLGFYSCLILSYRKEKATNKVIFDKKSS